MTQIACPPAFLRRLGRAALGACLAVLPALALPAAAGPDRLEDMVTIEVLEGGLTGDGALVGAIRLTLPQGWKTYWRAPGEAGIPPRFDWSGSRNLSGVDIMWPTPDVYDQDGMTTIVYENQMVLPIAITPRRTGQPVHLRGRLEFGFCKDVCIPGELSFDRRIDGSAPRNPAIVAAAAQRPYSEREAGVTAATCRIAPGAHGLQLQAEIRMPSAGGREVAVIEPGSAGFWPGATHTERRGDRLIATTDLIADGNAATGIDRSRVRITVLGQRHAVDIRGCSAG